MDGSGHIETRFGQAAQEYDRIRPGYPAELIDEVLDRAGAPHRSAAQAGPAIEVGAGTGQATRAFAARGLEVTAIEPDAAMAALLRERCGDLPNVHVLPVRFEDVGAGGFRLLYSAQAWHWTDPAVRWERAARRLAPGGTLALFWNFDRIADEQLQSEATAAHERYTPQISWDTDPVDEAALATAWPAGELASRPEFTRSSARLYRWQRTLTRADYLAYLSTHTPYLVLDAAVRDRLFGALAQTLPDDVPLAEDTVLHLATRTG
jgi:SAM-dependent methyltransferase